MLNLDTMHNEMVNDIQMDGSNKYLASCSSEGLVHIFTKNEKSETKDWERVGTLKHHTGPVWKVGWANSKFGYTLASCSHDGRVVVWVQEQQETWTMKYEYTKHTASVNAVDWGPHEFGQCFASASTDGSVAVVFHAPDHGWSDHKWEAHQGGANAVSWGPYLPSGSILPLAGEQAPDIQATRQLVTGGSDNLVKVWRFDDTATNWVPMATLSAGHTNWVRDVKWAPNLGLPFHTIASCGQDKKVIIWTQPSEGKEWTPESLPEFPDVVYRLSWTELGTVLAVSCGESHATLWRQADEGNWICMSQLKPPEE